MGNDAYLALSKGISSGINWFIRIYKDQGQL